MRSCMNFDRVHWNIKFLFTFAPVTNTCVDFTIHFNFKKAQSKMVNGNQKLDAKKCAVKTFIQMQQQTFREI